VHVPRETSEHTPIRIVPDPELLDLIPGYLKNREEDVRALRDALSGRDFEEVRVRGHKMKGSGGAYGFERITQLGRALEQCARETDTAGIAVQIDELAEFLSRVEIV